MRQRDIVRTFSCPFTGLPLAAVAAAHPDFALLHVSECDCHGNMRFPARWTNPHTDEWLASAAKAIVVSTERVVSHEEVRANPCDTWIAGHRVVAVVEMPHGAHPGSCNGAYHCDSRHLERYLELARSDAGLDDYMNEYVYGASGHAAYMERVRS